MQISTIKTRNFPIRFFCFMISVLFLLCSMAESTVFAAASNIRTIKVGFFSFPGYHEIENNSVRKGYGVDFLLLTQRYSDLN